MFVALFDTNMDVTQDANDDVLGQVEDTVGSVVCDDAKDTDRDHEEEGSPNHILQITIITGDFSNPSLMPCKVMGFTYRVCSHEKPDHHKQEINGMK